MEKKWSEKKQRRLKKLRAGTQLSLARTAGHGGTRAGAGRKKKTGRRNVSHTTRPTLGRRIPVHVTLRMRAGRASLRAQVLRNMFATIVKQIRRDDFHVAVFSLQHDHVHLICEPEDRAALSSGIRRLAIRFALRMNKLFGRIKGKSWGDRYHRHDLTTPREVRNALVYVLMNAKKHGDSARDVSFVDPFSSGAENDVWEDVRTGEADACLAPRFWLLGVGWRKHGLLRSTEAPIPKEGRARTSAG